MKERQMERGLKPRHVEMIALGGTIGVGLFMGAASTIMLAGPSVLLCYALTGVIMFLLCVLWAKCSIRSLLLGHSLLMDISILVLILGI